MNAKVPLPVDCRGITRLTQNLGQENFPFVHASDPLKGAFVFSGLVIVTVVRGLVPDHIVNSVTLGITPGQKSSPGRRAGRPGNVEVRQLDPALGQTVKMRGLDLLGPEASEIAIALVIGNDQHHVRRFAQDKETPSNISEEKEGRPKVQPFHQERILLRLTDTSTHYFSIGHFLWVSETLLVSELDSARRWTARFITLERLEGFPRIEIRIAHPHLISLGGFENRRAERTATDSQGINH